MFQNNFKNRVVIIWIIILLLFLLAIIKIFYIKTVENKNISIKANNLWSRNLPIGANRGNIYDRNGKLLAGNITTASLVVIPSQIENKEETAEKLSSILNVDYNDMLKHLNKKVSIEKIHPEGRRLDYKTADSINNLKLSGVYLLKEGMRYYPYKTLLSHVLGYVGIDNQGLNGIEAYYNKYLTGIDGNIKYYSDGQGKKLNKYLEYENSTSGMNLYLTIDLDIQKSVEKELDNVMIKYNPEQAFVIVMDPNNGEILAMSSRPNFDANNYQNYSKEVINRNLPIFNTYEPGSTFKIITLSAALEENLVKFSDKFYDGGSINVSGAKIKCWKKGGHGSENFLEVVMNSCNPGFVNLGMRLGKEKLMNYIKKFGFGSKTGIDLYGEEDGILFDVNKMGPLELATTSFGQGVSVSAIGQVNAIASAINGGYLYTPYLVKLISNPNTNEVIMLNEKKLKRQVISEETSSNVRYALENVVSLGTGRNAYIEGYRIGGKTGTAQKAQNGVYLENNYILSFIGFMPANNPKYLVYVAIDHPQGVTQYGGTVAAPIAKNIFKDIIEIKNLKQEKEGILKKYEVYDEKYVLVPNVINKTKKEARNILIKNNLLVEYSGTGDIVISQSPEANTYIKQNSVVKLMLN